MVIKLLCRLSNGYQRLRVWLVAYKNAFIFGLELILADNWLLLVKQIIAINYTHCWRLGVIQFVIPILIQSRIRYNNFLIP